MTTTPFKGAALTESDVPALPGRTLSRNELQDWVTSLAARPELWEHHINHEGGERHYASVYRDSNIDVWLLCWNTQDDTGWHDHDISSGAVVVTQGAVTEASPRMNGEPVRRVVEAGRSFSFGPDHVHRMGGKVDGSVSIHAYSPPLWRMGQYAIGRNGVIRRMSVSYADELRPMDDESVIERYKALQSVTDELGR
ncbi:cysteine dioxygenase [Arthrobacter sp. TMN-50]